MHVSSSSYVKPRYRGRVRNACLDPTQTQRHCRRPPARSRPPHPRRRLRRCRRGRKLGAASSDSLWCHRRCTSPCGRCFSLSTQRAHVHLSVRSVLQCPSHTHTHTHRLRVTSHHNHRHPAITIIATKTQTCAQVAVSAVPEREDPAVRREHHAELPVRRHRL